MVHSESKRIGKLLLFGDFVVIETNPWFDSESGHHYLENPPSWRVFAFEFLTTLGIVPTCAQQFVFEDKQTRLVEVLRPQPFRERHSFAIETFHRRIQLACNLLH